MELDALHLIKYLLYCAIIFPTMFGNGLILYCVYKFRFLRSNMHILIANLAVSDLLVGAVLIPLNLTFSFTESTQNKYVCLSILSLFVVCLGSSCINLAIISIERYLAITFPLKVRLLRKSKLVLMISFGWILAVCSSLPPVFGWNRYHSNETLQCYDQNIWTMGYINWINGEMVAFIVLSFICYAPVVRIAVRRARNRAVARPYILRNTKGLKELHHIMTMVIVLGTFAVCWLPYVVMVIVVQFWDTRQTDFARRVSLIPGLMNSAINWLIYGYRNPDYRRAFQIMLKKLVRRGSRT